MMQYINKAYIQAPVATCDTLSVLGHGSRQREQHLGNAEDKVVFWGRRHRGARSEDMGSDGTIHRASMALGAKKQIRRHTSF